MRRVIHNNLIIIKYLHKASPLYMTLNLIVEIFAAIMTTLNLVYIKLIVDNLTSDSPSIRYVIIVLAIAAATFILFHAVSTWVRNYFNIRQAGKIRKYMHTMVFKKVKDVDIESFEDPAFYNLYIKSMNELDNRVFGVINTIISVFTSIFLIISITSLITYLNPIYIVFSFIGLINSLYFANKQNKVTYERDMEVTPVNRHIGYIQRVHYLNQYAKEIKLFDISNLMLRKYNNSVDEHIDISLKHHHKLFWYQFLSKSNNLILTLTTMCFISVNIINKNLTIADLTVLLNAVNQLTGSFTSLLGSIPTFKLHSMYIENLEELLRYKSSLPGSDEDCIEVGMPAEIRFNNVSFRYPNSKDYALENINLIIKRGQRIAVVGENGVGKTTLVNLIMKLYQNTSGSIFYNDIDYDTISAKSIQSNIGIIFQDFQNYAVSVAENILIREPEDETDFQKVNEALVFAGLYKNMSTHMSTDSIITKEFDPNGLILSGGQLQKLSLARAYAKDCGILIMDEPSSHLDPLTELRLYKKILDMGKDKTVIFISHNLSACRYADKIVLLEKGRIVECGTHNELMVLDGKYAEMYNARTFAEIAK